MQCSIFESSVISRWSDKQLCSDQSLTQNLDPSKCKTAIKSILAPRSRRKTKKKEKEKKKRKKKKKKGKKKNKKKKKNHCSHSQRKDNFNYIARLIMNTLPDTKTISRHIVKETPVGLSWQDPNKHLWYGRIASTVLPLFAKAHIHIYKWLSLNRHPPCPTLGSHMMTGRAIVEYLPHSKALGWVWRDAAPALPLWTMVCIMTPQTPH